MLTYILGIDPGTWNVGYNVLNIRNNAICIQEYGLLKTHGIDNKFDQFKHINHFFIHLFKRYNINYVAMERILFNKNINSSISIAQVQGLIYSIAIYNHTYLKQIIEINSLSVKRFIGNYGLSSKESIAAHIIDWFNLSLYQPFFNKTNDITDALGISLYAFHYILKKI